MQEMQGTNGNKCVMSHNLS